MRDILPRSSDSDYRLGLSTKSSELELCFWLAMGNKHLGRSVGCPLPFSGSKFHAGQAIESMKTAIPIAPTLSSKLAKNDAPRPPKVTPVMYCSKLQWKRRALITVEIDKRWQTLTNPHLTTTIASQTEAQTTQPTAVTIHIDQTPEAHCRCRRHTPLGLCSNRSRSDRVYVYWRKNYTYLHRKLYS